MYPSLPRTDKLELYVRQSKTPVLLVVGLLLAFFVLTVLALRIT